MDRYRVAYSIKHINVKKGNPAWNGGSYKFDANDTREASNKCKVRVQNEILGRKELGPRTKIVINSITKIGKKEI